MQKPVRMSFEIAPDPDNRALADAWDRLDGRQRFRISEKVARAVLPQIFGMLDVKADVQTVIGGYRGEDNPSLAAIIPAETDEGKVTALAHALGCTLNQKEVILTSAAPFGSAEKIGIIEIASRKGDFTAEQAGDVYRKIYPIDPDALSGHTTEGNVMTIVNAEGGTGKLAGKLQAVLGPDFSVAYGHAYTATIRREDYEDASLGTSVRDTADRLRATTEQLLADKLRQSGVPVQR